MQNLNEKKILGTVPKKLQLVETFWDCPEFSRNKQNQKGITLIALIITIIVMLILVGVTINVALNGGLFEKAETASKQTQLAADKEVLYLQAIAAYNERTGEIDNTKLETSLTNLGWKDISIGNPFICTSPKGNQLKITLENGNIKVEEYVENNEDVPGNGEEDGVENWDNSQASLFTQENGTITGLSDLGKENLNNGETEFIIPNEIDGQKILAIGAAAFAGADLSTGELNEISKITNIKIPKGVLSIGDYAFGALSITSIEIPEGVSSIGNYCFGQCVNLTDITLPEGLNTIGSYVFAACSSLEEIIIPEGVTEIGGMAFNSCSSLSMIELPSTIEILCNENDSFDNCNENLTIKINKTANEIQNLVKIPWGQAVILDKDGNEVERPTT